MKKQDILKLMRSRLTKNNIEQKDLILEWLDELIEDVEEKNDIITYAERQYEKRYPNDIYVDRPIPPKLRIEVHKFQKSCDITDIEYKKYVEWLVQMCESVANRKTVPYDLCNQKLYDQFRIRRQIDNEIIVEKKSLNKNRLIKV